MRSAVTAWQSARFFPAGNNPEQIYDPCGYLYHLLSKPVQKIITIVCTVIVGAFTVFLVKGGFDLIAVTAKTGQRSPALQIPVANFYWIMTICFVLAVLRAVQVVFLDVTGKEKEQ